MKDVDFPTVDPVHPYELTEEESKVMLRLQQVFMRCEKLQRHVKFLFSKGGMYKIYNGNLLYHGCVPLNPDGSFMQVEICGKSIAEKHCTTFWNITPEEVIMPRKPKSALWDRI